MGSIHPRRGTTSSDVSALKDLLKSTKASVLVSGDEGYAKSIQRWSAAAEKPAGIAIVPTCAEDVSIVIKYASEKNIDVAVRCGGHSTAGVSSTDGGLLIDLHSGMRKVKVDAEAKKLYVDGGAIWRDVNDTAWEHRLSVVGGGVDDTGVGGLTLGGGYGLLSCSQGLSIDNLVGATIVTSSGEILQLSESENADLFWAIRGAGQNFGVVTQFVFQAHDQSEAYMGSMIWPATPEIIKSTLDFMNDIYEVDHSTGESKEGGKLFTLYILVKIPPMGNDVKLLLIHLYNGPESSGKKLLQPLFNLNPMVSDMRERPYPEANRLSPNTPGLRVSQKGAAFNMPVRHEFVTEMATKLDKFTNECPDAVASGFAWEIFNPAKVVNSDIGCFANRGWACNGLIMPQWTKAENDAVCRQWARDICQDFKDELKKTGEKVGKGVEGGAGVKGEKNAVMLYGNYDQYDEKSRDIFGDHYPRLQKIKARYDPGMMFDKLFPIQPAA